MKDTRWTTEAESRAYEQGCRETIQAVKQIIRGVLNARDLDVLVAKQVAAFTFTAAGNGRAG